MHRSFFTTFIVLLSQLRLIHASDAPEPVTFHAEDITRITLYGTDAVFLPKACPQNVTFLKRARKLNQLADNRIGFRATDLLADGQPCEGDSPTTVFDIFPIGSPEHYPPQWVFEDSSFLGFPVNLTCGETSLAIRYGYFNDVRTESGFLDPRVVYFDFAVIPNPHPFAFCSYAARREDGSNPIDYAPFPRPELWERVKEEADRRSVELTDAPTTPAVPSFEPTAEEDMDASPGPLSSGVNEAAGPLPSQSMNKQEI